MIVLWRRPSRRLADPVGSFLDPPDRSVRRYTAVPEFLRRPKYQASRDEGKFFLFFGNLLPHCDVLFLGTGRTAAYPLSVAHNVLVT
jgi:hypothetical protein